MSFSYDKVIMDKDLPSDTITKKFMDYLSMLDNSEDYMVKVDTNILHTVRDSNVSIEYNIYKDDIFILNLGKVCTKYSKNNVKTEVSLQTLQINKRNINTYCENTYKDNYERVNKMAKTS